MLAPTMIGAKGGFNPRQLFAANEQGAWYDPSDMSTLWQDYAKTTAVTAVEQPVSYMADKSGRGNDAYTPSNATASRPVLSARYNLLTNTEKFDGAAWFQLSATLGSLVPNPFGAVNAQTVTFLMGGYVRQSNVSFASNVSGTVSIYVRKPSGSTATNIRITTNNTATWGTGLSQSFVLSSTWTKIQVSGVIQTDGTRAHIIFGSLDASGNTDSSCVGAVEIWGADLRVANDGVGLPPYQRVNTSTDYDSDPSKFPHYLRFDGTDDYMRTGNIDFTSTDKMTVWAGVRKLATGEYPMVVSCYSAPSFEIYSNSPDDKFVYRSIGTIPSDAKSSSTSAPPVTVVLTGQSSISDDVAILRINASQAGSSTTDQGSGNYRNGPIHIGSRAGSLFWLTGYIYSLIIRGAQSSATQITNTETWVNTKTKAY